ncbi:MAG: OadG family transporter subunit [Myxococcota bacterium]
MLFEGVRLLVVGMTTVFAFLGILVVAMQATRAFASAFAPAEALAAPATNEDADIAVVLAAVAARRGVVR